MKALFGLLSSVAILAMIVGLIRPSIILPQSANPTRLRALAVTFGAFCAVVGLGVVVTENDVANSAPLAQADLPVTTEPVPVPMEVTPATAYTAGLGLTRSEVLGFFNDIGFAFQEGKPIDGMDNWNGRASVTNVQVLGPIDDIREISLMAIFSQDDKHNLTNLLQMAAFLNFVAPEWDGAMDWLGEAMKTQGGETMEGDRRVRLTFVRELGLATLTVSAAP